jgi:nucleotide-binding universal stress UspA family protein
MGLTSKVDEAVVVGVDGSESSLQALDWAADQARLEDRPLTLVHVSTLGGLTSPETDSHTISAVMHAEGRSVLQRAHARALAHHVRDLRSDLVMDDPRRALLEASRRAHLLVVGSRGRGPVASLLLGSVGTALSQHARCPVVVRRPGADAAGGAGVLVATDGLAHSEPAIAWASHLAVLRDRPLTVMRTVFDGRPAGPVATDDPAHEDVRAALREVAERLRRHQPALRVSERVERGLADEALVRVAAGMDVVVLGAHARRSVLDLRDLDVTTCVVEHAPGLVAVVPEAR